MNANAKLTDEARDAEARRRIREELDRNFLVEAAAGTGKTTSIVDRMVNLVASGKCAIENLVAVTFTRKAAAELRERFQAELRNRADGLQSGSSGEEREVYLRIQSASDNVNRSFVGTIHSFCAALLRERPIEFGVDPTFAELDEDEDMQLREQAWYENINDLFATNDPLIDQIDELGIDRKDLKTCFERFIEYRDVVLWPCKPPAEISVETIQQQTRDYINDMAGLMPFPAERGNDKLMGRYEEIVRTSGPRAWSRLGNSFRLLEKFDTSPGAVQMQWHDKKIAKREQTRWQKFREEVVGPALGWWCRKRYAFVLRFMRRAVQVYERQKAASGALDFTDLLLITAKGLKSRPDLRIYFQRRFTHLLVDEFQDTDPIQAEMILYLTAENGNEQDSFHCRPRDGSLFLVGDPKQSIYRFRRGDIVTYNRVKSIFEQSGGEVLSLIKNFRSRHELLAWNNRIYGDKFLATANQYTTAAEDMVQGRVDASGGELAGVYKLTLPTDSKIEETTRYEADSIARFIRHALDSGMTVPRSKRETSLGLGSAVEPRDFLIIPRGKKRIKLFKDALDRHGIPCEVTGGNPFSNVKQLGVLIESLRAIDDPHHAVHYLAVLRDRLFGFSDTELYEFKRAGGEFSFIAKVPEGLRSPLRERFGEVNSRLRRYQTWLRALPFSVAVNRIASDLGLLATVAAEAEGNISLGGFLKALEIIRRRGVDFDSASDLIGYFDRLETLDESEGCTALPPDNNVVRVMNLHKAKGLEAPVVFLTDTGQRYGGSPNCHIDRSGDQPIGYMGITARKGQWGRKEVATPAHWKQFQEEEQRFLDAEADRLLYVATTRAACMAVLSVGKERTSGWSGLHSYLTDAGELQLPPSSSDPPTRTFSPHLPSAEISASSQDSVDAIGLRWQHASQPSFHIESAKERALKGTSRPDWQASGDYGQRWGSAVHELLEIASKTPKVDLHASALLLISQYELGSNRVGELEAAIHSVCQSNIWQRAQQANRCFSELPFETISRGAGDQPTITRGVIDLIFEEREGWVIVDYKTDDITDADLPSAIDYYRRQLIHYADYWHESTGYNVAELGLYFTRINSYRRCTIS